MTIQPIENDGPVAGELGLAAVVLAAAAQALWWASGTALPVPLLAGPALTGGLWLWARAQARRRVMCVISEGTPSRFGGPQ